MWGIIVAAVGSLLAIVAVVRVWRLPEMQNIRGARLKRKALGLDAKGAHARAFVLRTRALRIFEKTGYDRARVATHIALARGHLSDGDAERTFMHAQAAYEGSDKPDYERFRAEACEVTGYSLLEQHKPAEAVRFFRERAAILRNEVDDEARCAKNTTMRVRSPGGGWAIIGRPPIEIAFQCLGAVLANSGVAWACLAAGDEEQCRQVIRQIVEDAEAMGNPASPRCLMAMRMVHLLEKAPENVEEKEAIRSLLDGLQEQRKQVTQMLDEGTDSSGALREACRILASFMSDCEQNLRMFKFAWAGVKDPGQASWLKEYITRQDRQQIRSAT